MDKKPYVPESKETRARRRSVSIYIGTTTLASEEDLSDIRKAVLEFGAPLVQVTAETGGKYGFYIKLKFEEGWNDLIKQFDIAASLQEQFGQMEPSSLNDENIF
jgi:hypothetical protein